MIVTLTQEEANLLIDGLRCRACFIETGTTYLRASDIANGHPGEAKPLSVSQMALIVGMDALAKKLGGFL